MRNQFGRGRRKEPFLAGDRRVPAFVARRGSSLSITANRRDRDAAVNLLGVGFDGRQRWRVSGGPRTRVSWGIGSEGRFGYLVEDRLPVQVGLIFDTAGWSSCRGDNTGPAGTFRPTSLGKRLPPNSLRPPPPCRAPLRASSSIVHIPSRVPLPCPSCLPSADPSSRATTPSLLFLLPFPLFRRNE